MFLAKALSRKWTLARLRTPGCEAIMPLSQWANRRVLAEISRQEARIKYRLHIGALRREAIVYMSYAVEARLP